MSNRPIVRWTIGESTNDGLECLKLSICSFLKFYSADVFICHNCKKEHLTEFNEFNLIDQSNFLDIGPEPKGVSWKLYPPRLSQSRYEIVIDNDIVFNEKIDKIDEFLSSDSTLLLEGDSRTYGRFQKHVPLGFQINSGIYGMPPNFDLSQYVKFYAGDAWEKNALYEHDKSETFDEQGLVALALLNYPKFHIISSKEVTNCENQLILGKGNHFIGLNRRKFHSPYRLYKSLNRKLYL